MIILRKNFWNFFKKSLPFLTILVLTSVFFWKVFMHGLIPFPGDFITGIYAPWTDYPDKWGYPAGVPVKNPLTADVPSFIYPMQTKAVDSVKNGEFGLWNPYILGGTPLMANFQSAPFSPSNFIYLFTDETSAWTLQVMLQHFLAILFTYILLRSWKLSKLSSILGGTIYAFSGFNLIWSQWNGHVLTAAFIPLVIYFEQQFILNNKIKFLAALTFVLALQLLSGYPQVVFYTYVVMLVVWLVYAKANKRFVIQSFWIGIFTLISIGLTAFQNLPGKELLSLSQRDSEPLAFSTAFLELKNIITFIAPDFFGNPTTQNYWGTGDYTNNIGFVGVIAILLAGIGLKRNSQKKITIGIVFISLMLSLPTFVSLFIWEEGFLGLQAASAHRALILFNLGIALMAGFGLESIRNRKIFAYKTVFLIIFVMLAIYSMWAIDISQQVAQKNLILPWMIFTISFLLILFRNKVQNLVATAFFIVCIFELFRFGWKFTPFSPSNFVFPTTPEIEYLVNQEKPIRIMSTSIPINLRMAYGLESLDGYDAAYPLRTAQFLASLSSNNSNATPHNRYGQIDNINSNLLDMANIGFYLVPKGTIVSSKFVEVFEGKSTTVLKSNAVLPRAFVISDWEVIENDKQILDSLLDKSFPLSKKIILEKEPSVNRAQSNYAEVKYLDYQDNSSKITVSSQFPAMLFISDVWYPGWKATVNGKPTEIYRANYIFRAVVIPEGNSVVEMSYSPESFSWGIMIAFLSLISLIFLVAILSRKDYTLRHMTKKNPREKTAAELHENVPPDWYYQSIRRNLLQRWWHHSRFSEVKKVIEKSNGKILDIGSADGMFTNVISTKSGAKQVLGIDVLPTSVSWANKHWKKSKMKFKVGDAHKLDYPTGTFDAVFALEVLEHVHKPQNVLKEIKRVLKKGGYGVFLVPSDNDLFLIVWFLVRKFWWAKIWEDTHLQSYRNGKLSKLSKQAGFDVEVDKKFWLGMLHLIKVRKK